MEFVLFYFFSLLIYVSSDKVLSHSKILSKTNNVNINSNNNKESIIILHGLLGSSRNFKTWASYLNDKLDNNYDIYCYDLRNHGRSTLLGPLRMDYSQMASDVITTMHHLGISKAHLIGHSMGGKVAATAALQYNSMNMFSSITMMDISPIVYTKEAFLDVSNTVTILKDIDKDFKLNSCKDLINKQIIEAFPDTSLRLFVQSNLQVKDNKLLWNFNLNEIYNDIHNIAGFPYDRSCVDINFNKPALILKGYHINKYISSISYALRYK